MPAFMLTESTIGISRACTLCPPCGVSALLGQNPSHKGGMSTLVLNNNGRFFGSASVQSSAEAGQSCIILVTTLSSRGRALTSSGNLSNHSCFYNVA